MIQQKPRHDFAGERMRLQGLALAGRELIAELDKRFQFRPPAMDAPERKLWRDAGSRDVVEWLLTLLKEAEAQTGPLDSVLGGSHALR
jgi:hypothetical protein